MKPIRLCHCIDNLTAGGAQQVVRHLVTGLDRGRFQPVVYTFQEGPIGDLIRRAGVSVRLFKRNVPKLDCNLVRSLRKSFKRERIEILHTHLFGATLHAMIAATGIPRLSKVVTLHAVREDNCLQRLAYPSLFSTVTQVVSVSRAVSRAMDKRYRNLHSKLVTIQNGIDTELFAHRSVKECMREKLNLPVDKPIIGTIGRLSTLKGYFVLLDSFAQIKKTTPDIHLVIIGEGELLHKLLNYKDRLNLNGAVQFLGSRNDVPELLQTMDIFVMSSLSEGLPLVLLEAMASNIPVVATRVGGIPEVVEDKKNGLLVPPGDSKSLAHAISTLLCNPSLGQQLASNALRKVNFEYSAEAMVQEHEKLYDRTYHRWIDEPLTT